MSSTAEYSSLLSMLVLTKSGSLSSVASICDSSCGICTPAKVLCTPDTVSMLTGVAFVTVLDGCTPDSSSDGSVVCSVSALDSVVVLVTAVISVTVWSDEFITLGAHAGSCAGEEVTAFCARCLLVVGPLRDGT